MLMKVRLLVYLVLVMLAASAVSLSVSSSFSQASAPSHQGSASGSSLLADAANFGNIHPGGPSASQLNYTAIFEEKGLPSGTEWTVNISSQYYSSRGSSITVTLPAGMYTYNVSNSLGFFTGNPSGKFMLNSGNSTIKITFNGRFAVNGYVDLNSQKFVNQKSDLSTNQSVFPVFGVFDNYSHQYIVSGYSSSRIYLISQNNLSMVDSFGTPSSPDALAFNSNTGDIYAIDTESVFVFNSTGYLRASLNLDTPLVAVSYNPVSNQILVGMLNGGIEAIDAGALNIHTSISNVSVFSTQSFAYNSRLGMIEAINDSGTNGKIAFISRDNRVAFQVNATGILVSIVYDSLDNTTYGIALTGGTSHAYVFNQSGAHMIPGSQQAFGLGYNPNGSYAILTNSQSSGISIVNTTSNSIVYSFSDPGMPLMPMSSPDTQGFTVVDPQYDSVDSVSITDAVLGVTFSEHGLASGTSWGVSVNGYNMTTNLGNLSFYESPGKYTFSVLPVEGYISYASGTFSVSSGPVLVGISFARTYNVTFSESGLGGENSWSVSLNGTTLSAAAGNDIIFQVPNGSYSFIVQSVAGYGFSPAYGSIPVDGASIAVPVTFAARSYNISFISTGLPSGMPWSITINGIVESTTGQSIIFQATPGLYAYSIPEIQGYYPAESSGAVQVVDSNLTVNVTWLPFLYKISFMQGTLPTGTVWGINLSNGMSLSSASGNATAYLQNGTYSYHLFSSNSSWTGTGGTFTVNGHNLTINVQFTPVTFMVTFRETGLPHGTMWNVQIGSTYLSTGSNSVDTELPNGTYSYSAYSSNQSYTSSGGNFTISGSTVTVKVQFALDIYTMHFNESGLPANYTWGVDISGMGNFTSNASEINVTAPVGTYTFSPLPVPGYNASLGSFLHLVNRDLYVSVVYTLIPKPALYNVTIMELGLPREYHWAVSINGTTEIADSQSYFNFQMLNGTYNLSIMAINPHGKVMKGGITFPVVVNGADQQILVLFYGPYVWLVFDFCMHGQHSGHDHHQDDHHNNRGNNGKDNSVMAAERYQNRALF